MALSYSKIRKENKNRYGWDIKRIGTMLLTERYDDRTHFIFELLQNAEDAIKRRPADWRGSRKIEFYLTETELRISHFGQPFNEQDVRGICGIAESSKEEHDIGRFGIGFKSTYAFTQSPEIHSGKEDFIIENFVWPKATSKIKKKLEETVFLIPFNAQDRTGCEHKEILESLQDLNVDTLLFLREINEIHWSYKDEMRHYIRQENTDDSSIRRVTLIRQILDKYKIDEEERSEWLVFSRPVMKGNSLMGQVEIAFALSYDGNKRPVIKKTEKSFLTVFFPTTIDTHLDFLVQGPYHTTPSRDNVDAKHHWNQHLVRETANLVQQSLRTLLREGFLNSSTLECFPIKKDIARVKNSMFCPLFEATKKALLTEPLLPRFEGGHERAIQARLGRTQAIRKLFKPAQLQGLYAEKIEIAWLSDGITQNRTPELWRYLREELDISEVTPDTIVNQLRENKKFLELQLDGWIIKLYEFLSEQHALLEELHDVPLIRLEDGSHIVPLIDGKPQAFLPSGKHTTFPTVKPSVCTSDIARRFLESLHLREPNSVDDIVENILPKFCNNIIEINDREYRKYLAILSDAYTIDSERQRNNLITSIKCVPFVRVVEGKENSRQWTIPSKVFLANDEERKLFAAIPNVLFVECTYEDLQSAIIRELLEECGAITNCLDIIINLIFPKYKENEINVSDTEYEADIRCILTVWENTFSNSRERQRMINEINDVSFIQVVDAGQINSSYWCTADATYLANETLKNLFDGVPGVYMVDDNCQILCDEKVIAMLQDLGVASRLKRVPVDSSFSHGELADIRRREGLERSYSEEIKDWSLQGVEKLLNTIPKLSTENRIRKSTLLWHALQEIVNESPNPFKAEYRWKYYHQIKYAYPDSRILKLLRQSAWIPDNEGNPKLPQYVRFALLQDIYCWNEESTLQSIIGFKPPTIDLLAQEVGLEPELIDKLQEKGIKLVDIEPFLATLDIQHSGETQLSSPSNGSEVESNSDQSANGGKDDAQSDTGLPHPYERIIEENDTIIQERHIAKSNRSQVMFYIQAHPRDVDEEPNSRTLAARMQLEAKAIELILQDEPNWKTTMPGQPGFDLYQTNQNGDIIKYCEVKALSNTLDNHFVRMTRQQFETAWRRGSSYWLYIVESINSDCPKIIRIKNPAHQAHRFTFDSSWRAYSSS